MRQQRICGVFPPLPTPFEPSGAISFDALSSNLQWWNAQDLAGYVVLGSNGEAVHLAEPERFSLVEFVRSKAPDSRWVIAGTGLLSTEATIRETMAAAAAGADAALVLPPYYYRGLMTEEALRDHFLAVAEASPIPVLLYNMPANTGIDMQVDLIAELSAHPSIVGIKDSGGNVAKLAELRDRVSDEFVILAGSAGFLLPALSVGADGGVLALANIAPSLCVSILTLARRSAWEEARDLQARVASANSAVTRRWGVPAIKAAMDMIGLYGGPPRRPLRPLGEPALSELRTILTTAGILPKEGHR
jgi:4-hydroxy-2-oxoglutarate aldolase